MEQSSYTRKSNHKQFFHGCHHRSSAHLKVLKMLLCDELERAEVTMGAIHTLLLLYNSKNREQLKSCGNKHFFSTSIWAIGNSKVVKLHFQMGKKKEKKIFFADLSLHKSLFIDILNTELSDKCKQFFSSQWRGCLCWTCEEFTHARMRKGRELAN